MQASLAELEASRLAKRPSQAAQRILPSSESLCSAQSHVHLPVLLSQLIHSSRSWNLVFISFRNDLFSFKPATYITYTCIKCNSKAQECPVKISSFYLSATEFFLLNHHYDVLLIIPEISIFLFENRFLVAVNILFCNLISFTIYFGAQSIQTDYY